MEYLPLLSFLELGHKGKIKASDCVYLMQKCPDTEQEVELESKMIGFALDYVHKARSTLTFLSQKAQIQRSLPLDYVSDMNKILKATGVQCNV